MDRLCTPTADPLARDFSETLPNRLRKSAAGLAQFVARTQPSVSIAHNLPDPVPAPARGDSERCSVPSRFRRPAGSTETTTTRFVGCAARARCRRRRGSRTRPRALESRGRDVEEPLRATATTLGKATVRPAAPSPASRPTPRCPRCAPRPSKPRARPPCVQLRCSPMRPTPASGGSSLRGPVRFVDRPIAPRHAQTPRPRLNPAPPPLPRARAASPVRIVPPPRRKRRSDGRRLPGSCRRSWVATTKRIPPSFGSFPRPRDTRPDAPHPARSNKGETALAQRSPRGRPRVTRAPANPRCRCCRPACPRRRGSAVAMLIGATPEDMARLAMLLEDAVLAGHPGVARSAGTREVYVGARGARVSAAADLESTHEVGSL